MEEYDYNHMTIEKRQELEHDIKAFFKGDVMDDAKSIEDASRDASMFQVRPELILCPKDVKDICALVSFVSKQRQEGEDVSITARSAGTDMTGGPLTTSLVLSMTKYFHHIKEIGKDFIVTEPGVYYRDFEKDTLAHGLLLPSYPASREICTIGGMVANNSGGEKTLTYGKTEKFIRRIKMVIHDGIEEVFEPLTMAELEEKKKRQDAVGEIYRKMFDIIDGNYDEIMAAKPNVSKNSAGYYLWNVYDRENGIFDLTKMIVGSQGTFGIITEATLGLIKPEPHSRLLVILLRNIGDVAKIANHILKYKPESFESYDDHTFRVALKFLPDIAKRLGSGIVKIAYDFLPEFWMVLTGGVPKLILIAQFTGETGKEAEALAREAQKSLVMFHVKSNVTHSEKEGEKYWIIRRESFSLLRHHMHGLRTAPFIDDFVVRPEYLPEFLPRLYKILDATKLLFTIAGHVGDGNFHIIPLMDFSKPGVGQIIEDLSKKIYALVLSYHGSITGEHNDGLIRTPFLKEMYGERIYALFEQTKKIFDPDDIFNPGKKVDASLKYAFDHLDTKM